MRSLSDCVGMGVFDWSILAKNFDSLLLGNVSVK